MKGIRWHILPGCNTEEGDKMSDHVMVKGVGCQTMSG